MKALLRTLNNVMRADPLSSFLLGSKVISFSVLEGGVRSRIQGTYLLLVVKDRGIMGNGEESAINVVES